MTQGALRKQRSKSRHTWNEINEEPDILIKSSKISVAMIKKVKKMINDSQYLYITGSGSSFFCAYLAKYLFGLYSKPLPELVRASQLKFIPDYIRSPKSTMLIISQSGRTDDVLSAAKIAKLKNIPIISIVNDLKSPLANVSTLVLPMLCGTQNSAVATKSIVAQFTIIYKIISSFRNKKNIDFQEIHSNLKLILKQSNNIKKIAKHLKNSNSIHVIGNGMHFTVAQEGSRKLEELVRINAKENVSDELIHGPIATFDEKTFVIFLNPVDSSYLENLNFLNVIKQKGTKVIGISDKNNEKYDFNIIMPTLKNTHDGYLIMELLVIHLLAYFTAKEKGRDPDNPKDIERYISLNNPISEKKPYEKYSKNKKWDVFISHATEDKEIALPLREQLANRGLDVWYDQDLLKWGYSLTDSISLGLKKSLFGVVIFSKTFFKKKWTNIELNTLVSLSSNKGDQKILPLLYKITHKQLVRKYPILADIVARDWNDGLDDLSSELKSLVDTKRKNI